MKTVFYLLLPLLSVCIVTQRAAADEGDVRQAIQAYVDAFNQKDLAAVSNAWTEDAVHVDSSTGETTEGRSAIVSDIAEVFKNQPETRLSGSIDSVEMLTAEVAEVEGETRVGPPGEAPYVFAFSAVLIEKDGLWQIKTVEESIPEQVGSAGEALQELEWLVGSWVDQGEQERVATTVRWTENGNFLTRSFVVSDDQETIMKGTQVIGWDARSGEIRSWTFNSDGSFGTGVWKKKGADWYVQSSQNLANGQAAIGTFVISQEDPNSMSLQLIGHEIDGAPQPTGQAVIAVRIENSDPVLDASSGNVPPAVVEP
ncbi:SnoaL-like domain protein [Roseimaritima multifibrata]|uniref:SnoaL-like domain protein n=1 Tax=Roseimaritima multifibrata TaxID=1930274 RepID=A0A517MFT2_9BACT|nr:SnoaL-like domain protein [Roseimaritima multifibrata]